MGVLRWMQYEFKGKKTSGGVRSNHLYFVSSLSNSRTVEHPILITLPKIYIITTSTNTIFKCWSPPFIIILIAYIVQLHSDARCKSFMLCEEMLKRWVRNAQRCTQKIVQYLQLSWGVFTRKSWGCIHQGKAALRARPEIDRVGEMSPDTNLCEKTG